MSHTLHICLCNQVSGVRAERAFQKLARKRLHPVDNLDEGKRGFKISTPKKMMKTSETRLAGNV